MRFNFSRASKSTFDLSCVIESVGFPGARWITANEISVIPSTIGIMWRSRRTM